MSARGRLAGPGTVALLAAGLTAALVLAGCGQTTSRGSQLASYLKHVQRIETQLRRPLAAVSVADRALAGARRGGSGPNRTGSVAAERSLHSSIGRQQALRAQLAAIETPSSAARLRTLVLQLADRQIALTSELSKLVVFLPRFSAVLQALAPATHRLQRVLATGGTYASSVVAAVLARKAAGLRTFQAAIADVAARLKRLQPPRLALPEYRTQLASLAGLRASAGRLAGALAAGSGAGLSKLLLSFNRSASLSHTVAAQRAQIAAIRAWDRGLVGLRKLSVAVARERYRLVRTVS